MGGNLKAKIFVLLDSDSFSYPLGRNFAALSVIQDYPWMFTGTWRVKFEDFGSCAQCGSFNLSIVARPICVLATLLQFHVRGPPGRKINCEDHFVLIAPIAFVICASCNRKDQP